ncbi:MAG: HpcH/HpaI aldolase/citrate lyase family protein [Candidatus Adiutrix sp.]|jgi:citrate lyase beta subunit|nr:HpcH/HpaI aldolase/citrate lyase family protein [Candidatus Adiutrix sp.]
MLNSLAIDLGATLYIPSTHEAILDVANLKKYPQLRSLVFCAEDSVAANDLPKALANLARVLPALEEAPLSRFIRPKNPELLEELLTFDGIERLDGFVLPKADLENLPRYFKVLERHERFVVMPILETGLVFDLNSLCELRDFLAGSKLKSRIKALRIGALDLLSLLHLRRQDNETLYETPLAYVMDQLIAVFRPAGFSLTAPGCECFGNPELLVRELDLDINRGLFGKTALHPEQVGIIHAAYRVSERELMEARAVNDPSRPAVFRLGDRMFEKAVHQRWAATIEARHEIYGLKN